MENAIHHNPKTAPTNENSSLLIPLLVKNKRYQMKNIALNIMLKIESVFMVFDFDKTIFFVFSEISTGVVSA